MYVLFCYTTARTFKSILTREFIFKLNLIFSFPPPTPLSIFQLPELTDCYSSYCVNQLAAKSLLDEKKQEKRVQDFLERCQESPFSRKLDLWNFLDVPRSRLVKYPLLLKNILRLTPVEHEDKSYLTNAVSSLYPFCPSCIVVSFQFNRTMRSKAV